jgi:hypothetical protein
MRAKPAERCHCPKEPAFVCLTHEQATATGELPFGRCLRLACISTDLISLFRVTSLALSPLDSYLGRGQHNRAPSQPQIAKLLHNSAPSSPRLLASRLGGRPLGRHTCNLSFYRRSKRSGREGNAQSESATCHARSCFQGPCASGYSLQAIGRQCLQSRVSFTTLQDKAH